MSCAEFLPYEEVIVKWLPVGVSSRVLIDASQSKGWLSCFCEDALIRKPRRRDPV